MKRSTTIVALFIFILCCSTLTASAQTDEQRIKEVITSAYVNGIQNSGSLEDIDSGFHPCFELISIGTDSSTVTIRPIYIWREAIRQAKEAGKVPAGQAIFSSPRLPMMMASLNPPLLPFPRPCLEDLAVYRIWINEDNLRCEHMQWYN